MLKDDKEEYTCSICCSTLFCTLEFYRRHRKNCEKQKELLNTELKKYERKAKL